MTKEEFNKPFGIFLWIMMLGAVTIFAMIVWGTIYGFAMPSLDIASLPFPAMLALMGVVAFVQNMAFTAVSRSRNSADVAYHRRCAWASNGIWFVTQVILFSVLWSYLIQGEMWKVAMTGFVYVLATTEGSCLQMRRMLAKETGGRRVGAQIG